MFDKTKLKIIEKILESANPGRGVNVEKIGNLFVMTKKDTVGCNSYILDGLYSYDQVMELNKMTGYEAGFGFCKGRGPIAFIGVPNPEKVQNSGYFRYDVQEYGDSFKEDEDYFEHYSEEEAKKSSGYTVYGLGDPRILENKAPIKKVNHFHDYRYKRKEEFKEGFDPSVLEMEIKLGGAYSFYEARKFAYGSTGQLEGASGENVPIQFAIVGDKEPVGILGLWKHYDNSTFKDVWADNEEKPQSQPITFLDDEEARKIKEFKLYYFRPTHSFGRKKHIVEKKDRMFSEDYDFKMDDGTDYRLQEVKEPQKIYVKQ